MRITNPITVLTVIASRLVRTVEQGTLSNFGLFCQSSEEDAPADAVAKVERAGRSGG
jgi:hypothetical protein